MIVDHCDEGIASHVRLDNMRARDIPIVITSLEQLGLKKGVDYSYAYYPGWYTSTTTSGHIVVKFSEEKYASWFRLTRK